MNMKKYTWVGRSATALALLALPLSSCNKNLTKADVKDEVEDAREATAEAQEETAEAVEARAREEGEGYRGRISVEMGANDTLLTVTVTDNGVGLPKTSESILEPYVTTREKGTGLGLAIVKKIVEEHGGDLAFSSVAEGRGTTATLRFALAPTDFSSGSEPAE